MDSTPGHLLRERGDKGRGAPEGTGEDGTVVGRNTEGQRQIRGTLTLKLGETKLRLLLYMGQVTCSPLVL